MTRILVVDDDPGLQDVFATVLDEEGYTVQVTDNGQGLSPGSTNGTIVKEGVGLANTQARLKQLYGDNHRLDLANTARGGLTVILEVEVTPEFALPSIEKITVKRPKLEATDERLNLAVENLRKYFGNWHDSTEPATDADTITADVKVTSEDGTVIAEQPQVSLQAKPGSIGGVRFEDMGEKLVGSTIVREGEIPCPTWGEKNSAPRDIRKSEEPLEQAVEQNHPRHALFMAAGR